jgi:hypothetical protein
MSVEALIIFPNYALFPHQGSIVIGRVFPTKEVCAAISTGDSRAD